LGEQWHEEGVEVSQERQRVVVQKVGTDTPTRDNNNNISHATHNLLNGVHVILEHKPVEGQKVVHKGLLLHQGTGEGALVVVELAAAETVVLVACMRDGLEDKEGYRWQAVAQGIQEEA
jgi:hypothetical protein